jgi:hypothetical protein
VQKNNRIYLKSVFGDRDVRYRENEKFNKRSEKIIFAEINKFGITIKLLRRDLEFSSLSFF